MKDDLDTNDAVAEIERLREILSAYEQEADLHDENTQDLVDIINGLQAQVNELEAEHIEFLGTTIPSEYYRGLAEGRTESDDEVERLRAQVAELLPWAGAGALAKYQAEQDMDAESVLRIVARYLRDAGAYGSVRLLERIGAGEFGGVS